MGYAKILVALESFNEGEVVFNQALDLAKKEGAKLMLFHCLPYEQNINPYTDIYGQQMTSFSRAMQAPLQEAIQSSRDWLADCAQTSEDAGIEAEFDCRLGDAGHAICKLAKDWQAELIMVGRRGRQGISEMILGSVSNYVVHHAHCSVLVVQGIMNHEE